MRWRVPIESLRRVPVRIVWRLLVFDIAAPLATIAGLLAIGVVLRWPQWWVSVCSMLVLLIVEGAVANFLLARRASVSVGTDDAVPVLRLAVVALCTAALVAAVAVGYTHWTVPERDLKTDSTEVVHVATDVAAKTATVVPGSPMEFIEQAATMVAPGHVEAFKKKFGTAASNLASRNVTVEATALAAGVEKIGPSMARAAVLLRTVETPWDRPAQKLVVAARVTLTKQTGRWLVLDLSPIHHR